MTGGMEQRAFIFCLVSRERADALLPRLLEHFACDPRVEVLVERRAPGDRERPANRAGGRDRRAPVVAREIVRALPPELRGEIRHLRFVQRLEAVRVTHQDTGTAELVQRIRAGDPEAVTELWWRFFERVRLRLRLRLGDAAGDAAASEALGRILDELDGYDSKRQPLAAWLDGVVDRYVAERGAH
jgi:hypothetical protein